MYKERVYNNTTVQYMYVYYAQPKMVNYLLYIFKSWEINLLNLQYKIIKLSTVCTTFCNGIL